MAASQFLSSLLSKCFHSKTYLQFLITIFISSVSILAQGVNSYPEILPRSLAFKDTIKTKNSSATTDSLSLDLFPESQQSLLPDKMSFMEKGLWGEHGFFRNIGIASKLTPEGRQQELEARRTMLTIHQIGGFTTLGLMIATVYFGQKTLDGDRGAGGTHQTFVALTIGSYSLTGLLAVLSPPPIIRRDDETSTTSIHKTLAWFHFAGMIVTPILGSLIGGNRHLRSHIDQAHYHQIAGYITTGLFAASMIVVTF